MFKILLKHFIYEKCIDIIFDGIERSFMLPDGIIYMNIEYNPDGSANGILKYRYNGEIYIIKQEFPPFVVSNSSRQVLETMLTQEMHINIDIDMAGGIENYMEKHKEDTWTVDDIDEIDGLKEQLQEQFGMDDISGVIIPGGDIDDLKDIFK